MHHQNKYIIIDTDIEVEIESLIQTETYAGLMVGYPTEHRNNRLIKSILSKANEINDPKSVYLIQPQQKLMDVNIHNYKNQLDIPKELPNIQCRMRVRSNKIISDANKTDSTMIIIWFQDTFAFPIDPMILENIKVIPYRQLCFFRK